MPQIEVISRPVDRTPIADGFGRRRAFENETLRVGETRVAPGAKSPWHHHGTRVLFGFVVSGELTLEYGPGGREKVRPVPGEFFRIEPGCVHRDVNDGRVEAVIVNMIVGDGPAMVNVDGPEG